MRKRQIFQQQAHCLCLPLRSTAGLITDCFWRLAMMPPLKMREQLVSESIILCVPRHSAGAIISHQFRAYRWTRRIWSCKHSCGKQKEHASGTARGAQIRGLHPSAQSARLKSLHKDWIDVHAGVCICYFPPVLFGTRRMPRTLQTNWLLMGSVAWPSKEWGAAIVPLLAQYQVCLGMRERKCPWSELGTHGEGKLGKTGPLVYK